MNIINNWNVKINRRTNLALLAEAVGGVSELARILGKSPSQIGRLIGNHINKNIGDKLAADIERAFAKCPGWLDWDYSGQQEIILASTIPPANCYRVPLLRKNEVNEWICNPAKRNKNKFPITLTSVSVSAAAYGFCVPTDSMESTGGITFPQGSLVIVDPEYPIENEAHVLVRLAHEYMPIFRQIRYRGNKPYLHALNPRYPQLELTGDYSTYGVVRQLMVKPELTPYQRAIL